MIFVDSELDRLIGMMASEPESKPAPAEEDKDGNENRKA